MATNFALASTSLVALPRQSLAALRSALIRDLGGNYATYLQESGYAGGEAIFAAFREWLAARGGNAEGVSFAEFQGLAAEFFRDTGWGTLAIGTLHDVVITLDSTDWAEADPTLNIGFPACYYSMGLLADFFGRLAEAPLACYEVECRSNGAPRCRFLLGSAEVIGQVYQRMSEGVGYEEAVQELV
ncbi:MAG TPA: V4R domain-containing protein [Gemmatimonadaceae bacterium]|jgi:predicted hydrocarbon binding protein